MYKRQSYDRTGSVTLADGTQINDIPTAIKHSIAYTSKDRDNESVVLNQSIGDNICLPSLDELAGKSHLLSDKKRKEFADKYPEAKIVASTKAIAMLPQFFEIADLADRAVAVKEGEELSLGSHTLQFFMAPMVHWPEVMVEYEKSEKILFSADGFGKFGALDAEPTVFTGYETLNDTGVVVALSDEETLTDAIATDEEAKDGVLVVLDKTPFYAEMGGQVADHGVLTSADCSLRVLDVKKTPKGYYVHTCVLESGIVKVGDHLTAKVDKEYRMAIARNHTATHLLQAALREVLGDHVHQAGSYQDASITHFDFTHFSAVTPEELARVQKIVNDKIFDSMNVTVQEMPVEEAKKLGAMALFGEKYGKVVRVVDIEGWSTCLLYTSPSPRD